MCLPSQTVGGVHVIMTRHLALCLGIFLSLTLPVAAAHRVIDFESQPEDATAARHDVTIGDVNFLGGMIGHILNDPTFKSHCYWTAYVPTQNVGSPTMSETLAIQFAHPTANAEVDIWNGVGGQGPIDYRIRDDNGHELLATAPAFTGDGHSSAVHAVFPYANIHRLYIEPAYRLQYSYWDFGIDNLQV
jgi:hypothetical protein